MDEAASVISSWLRAHTGGTVGPVRRQARWRPVWFVDVDQDGEVLELVVRGARTDSIPAFPLEHEMRFQRLLGEHGIAVPRVHGWIDDLPAFVIDRVPGRPDFEDATDHERQVVMDEYLAELARIHHVDPEPFAAAGIVRAGTPAEAGEVGMQHFEAAYRAMKRRPDPFLEFFLGWLRRNPLDHTGGESVILWDSGQFHHRDGHLVAILDVEMGHIGDPMMDLAGFIMRDTVLRYGDLASLFDRYERAGGVSVDLDAVRHHHLAWTLSNQLAFHAALAQPGPGSDYMTNLQWVSETNLFAVEVLAETLGVELDVVELPVDDPSPFATAYEQLVRTLRTIAVGDEFARYEVRRAFRLARHLQRVEEIGAAIVAADQDEVTTLIGRRPASWDEGEAALEQFVLDDDGRHDVELLHLFHRRLRRSKALLGPSGSAMATHHPLQPVPGPAAPEAPRSSHTSS